MPNDSSRNTIVFIVCALVILVLYQMFVMEPHARQQQLEAKRAAEAAAPAGPAGSRPGVAPVSAFVPRAQAAAASPRVAVDTPSLKGSVALKGARIDDLYLKRYHQSADKASPLVELFRPEGAEHAYFAEFGWAGANVPNLPTPATVWTAEPGATLTPQTPLTLTYDNGQGLVFKRTISIDADYMFTVADTVTNAGAAPVSLSSYGSIQQQGLPTDLSKSGIIHEGAIGALSGEGGKSTLKLAKYKGWKKDGVIVQDSTGGWLGITEKYWLAAAIPAQNLPIKGEFRVVTANNIDVYEAGYVGPAQAVAPGKSLSATSHLFAGAKTVPLLKGYEKSLNIPRFEDAVDWGMFWFFTKPIFQVLEFFNKLVGNFGIAILLLTVTVKAVFFPLANKSYESISKMKKVQPQIEAIKKRNEKDPAKLQQETMALYQAEKINPFMGCLPMLIQIPVFYSLYKVLSVTIEMRQAPFYGWVHDLSQRDPTTLFNLFGLIPWDPSTAPIIGSFLAGTFHIGVWPLIYGFTMWLTQAMSPPAGVDPMQQRMFQLFPIIFTFTLSQFAVGLVIYWCWNNFLSILQQYVIMRRYKVDNPIDQLLARFGGGAKASSG